jgi:hypothetical protein
MKVTLLFLFVTFKLSEALYDSSSLPVLQVHDHLGPLIAD